VAQCAVRHLLRLPHQRNRLQVSSLQRVRPLLSLRTPLPSLSSFAADRPHLALPHLNRRPLFEKPGRIYEPKAAVVERDDKRSEKGVLLERRIAPKIQRDQPSNSEINISSVPKLRSLLTRPSEVLMIE